MFNKKLVAHQSGLLGKSSRYMNPATVAATGTVVACGIGIILLDDHESA